MRCIVISITCYARQLVHKMFYFHYDKDLLVLIRVYYITVNNIC